MRTCNKCLRVLSPDAFDWRTDTNNGRRRRNSCRECYRTPAQSKVVRYEPGRRELTRLNARGLSRCSRCKETKPIPMFTKLHGGVGPYCRKCMCISAKEYRDSRTPEQKKKISAYTVQWRNADPARVLRRRLEQRRRSQLRRTASGQVRRGDTARSISKWLGCTSKEFHSYIEAQFRDGMTWENMDKWEIDHVVPLFHIDPMDEEAMKKAWHYSNMRPLWAKDNRSRPKRIERVTHQPELLFG